MTKPVPGAVEGRPSEYEPAFCETVEASLAEGLSLAACAGVIGCARSTIYLWAEAHSEFSDAVKRGQAKSVLFWERALLRVAEKGGGPGTATAVIFGLKNRAPEAWRDKVEHEHSGPDGGAIQHDNIFRLEFVEGGSADPSDPIGVPVPLSA